MAEALLRSLAIDVSRSAQQKRAQVRHVLRSDVLMLDMIDDTIPNAPPSRGEPAPPPARDPSTETPREDPEEPPPPAGDPEPKKGPLGDPAPEEPPHRDPLPPGEEGGTRIA